RRKLDDRLVDCGADGAGGAVDVLESGRYALEEEDGALGGDEGVLLGDLLDLGNRLADSSDCRLRLPSERVSSEPGAKGPGMREAFPAPAPDLVDGGVGFGAVGDVVRRSVQHRPSPS